MVTLQLKFYVKGDYTAIRYILIIIVIACSAFIGFSSAQEDAYTDIFNNLDKPGIENLVALPAYYQRENMTISFSVASPGSIGYNGTPVLTVPSEDSRINALPMRVSPIHDFIGFVLMFLSASYLVLLFPEWNIMFITGTLVVYYTVINLHGDRK